MRKVNDLYSKIDEIDDKIIKIIEKLVIAISKSRKELYNQLNQNLLKYSEEELLELLDYTNTEIDELTNQMIKDRFNYLKYKYEKMIQNLKIEIDTNDIFKSSFAIIPESIIVINPKQIFHLSRHFKVPIEQTMEVSILHELGHILDRNIDFNLIGLSNKVFIQDAKNVMFYRIEKEKEAWDIGKEFIDTQDIKYKENLYELLKFYSIGCYILHYRNMVWCSLS